MLPKIEKILYTTDLSASSAFAFQYAVLWAEKHDARIVLLHVIEKIPPTAEMLITLYLGEDKREEMLKTKIDFYKERITERLRGFSRRMLAESAISDNRVEAIEVCEGVPVDEILTKAREFGSDVIVMGTHGKGIIRNTFLGSTARRLMRRTRLPVIVIPLPKETTQKALYDI